MSGCSSSRPTTRSNPMARARAARRSANLRFAATFRCGNNRASWNTYPMPRCSAGTSILMSPSKSTASSSATRPRSGRSRPAMMLMVVVLPHPDGPNSATTPGVGESKLTSRRNASSCLTAATLSISAPACGAPGAQTIPRPASRRAPASPKGRRAGPRRASPPGSCRAEYSASGSVRVSPGMFDTNVMTAPNSPKRGRESRDGAGQQSGQHQRQSDGREAVERRRRPACAPHPRGRGRCSRGRCGWRGPSGERTSPRWRARRRCG